MFHLRETNPHFQSRQLPYPQNQPPRQQDGSDLRIPTRPRPQSQLQPQVGQPPASRPKIDNSSQSPPPRVPQQPQSRAPPVARHRDAEFQPSSLRVPTLRKTRRITWLAAIFCVVFWVIVIIGGLALLIIYLSYHPRIPKFDVSSASLNAAYLDMGYLLNADMNLLANFTNPNKKVKIDLNDLVINLYFEGAHIATRYIDPLSVSSKHYKLSNVHMVSSQVAFSKRLSQHFAKQMESGRIMFEIKGYLRTTSYLGSFLKYSYWLYGHCNFVVSAPPGGVMIAKKCVTKR